MPNDKYSVTQYSVSNILGFISCGQIAIPEIQRPFVWKPTNVRDLIDSLYNGYPTGYLIIWQNPEVKLKNGASAVGKQVLIDGQQRVTGLMTAIGGHTVLNDNYEEKVYRIAFNPLAKEDEEHFAVQTPAHIKSSNWIPDIALLFRDDFDSFSFIQDYVVRNPGVSAQEINKAITKVQDIRSCQMGAIILVPQLDINEVTEIFVRINSQGKRLNESDFAMSKIAADEKYGGNMLRKAIDYFCHIAVEPSFYSKLAGFDAPFMASEYEPIMRWLKDDTETIYDPDYNDMLRVSFMHKFNRGKLGDLVSLLSRRDFLTRTYKEEIAEESFGKLTSGVKEFMSQYALQNFVLTIKSLGYISNLLLGSKMTLDFAYTLFLILQQSGEVPKIEVKRLVQKWFLLSSLTGRYVGSSETRMDADLHAISQNGFRALLKENEESQLSDTFWDVGLVQSLETASVASPYYCAFVAAQIFFSDNSLFSNSTKVTDLVAVTGDVHHIFPKEYLKQNGITDKSQYNQIANYANIDTAVNISIGKKAPNVYFHDAFEQCRTKQVKVGTIIDETVLQNNLTMNCIPEDIAAMTVDDYPRFLDERRRLMAGKIKKFYESI